MTAVELITAMLRRWYVTLLGAALTAGLFHVATNQPGVYWTQFNVVLVAPLQPQDPNYLEDPRQEVYPLAGVVAVELNRGHEQVPTASADTTMIGVGSFRGEQVRVPNLGSQWGPDYTASWLDVQVADESPEAVAARADRVRRDIARVLQRRQDEYGVPADLRVTSVPSTADPVIHAVRGDRRRAAAGSLLLGALLTALTVYGAERRSAARRGIPKTG